MDGDADFSRVEREASSLEGGLCPVVKAGNHILGHLSFVVADTALAHERSLLDLNLVDQVVFTVNLNDILVVDGWVIFHAVEAEVLRQHGYILLGHVLAKESCCFPYH